MNILSLNSSYTGINFNKNRFNNGGTYPNLAPLPKDTISFGAMKKNQFENIDLMVVNKFKIPIEKFNNNNDLQKWCKEKIEKDYLNKIYDAKDLQAVYDREEQLNEWNSYCNNKYSNTLHLLIIDSITKDLKDNNNNLPPVLNKNVLEDTISEMKEKLKNKPKSIIDFKKLYETKLNKKYLNDLYNENKKSYSGWVKIPSKENDAGNFEKNVNKLKALSHHNWCTKSFNAEPYLATGDFHVYMEEGKPKIGIRFKGNVIEEIQGERNIDEIPVKYLDIVKEHTKGIAVSKKAYNEFKYAIDTKEKIDEFKLKLGKPVEEATNEELFKAARMFSKKDADGLIILKNYGLPNCDFSWEDINVDENKLFTNVKEIIEDADFSFSTIKDLNHLEKIGGDAYFSHSLVKNLGKLKTIGGNACFDNSLLTDVGEIETIGKCACFVKSKIKNLNNLQKIGGHADFKHSKITDLGNLKEIGGNADLSFSEVVNIGKLKKIDGSVLIYNAKINPDLFNDVDLKAIYN